MVQLLNFFFFIIFMVVLCGTAAPVLFQLFVSRDVSTGAPFFNGTLIPILISEFLFLVYLHSRKLIRSMDRAKSGVLVRASRPILFTDIIGRSSSARNAFFCFVPVLNFLLLESMGDRGWLESFCGLSCIQFFRTLFSLPRAKRERISQCKTLRPNGNEQRCVANYKMRCPGYPYIERGRRLTSGLEAECNCEPEAPRNLPFQDQTIYIASVHCLRFPFVLLFEPVERLFFELIKRKKSGRIRPPVGRKSTEAILSVNSLREMLLLVESTKSWIGLCEPITRIERSIRRTEDLGENRIRSRIAFFVESLTSECLAQAKKRLIHLIRLANDLRFAGTTKTTISLFPFFGATFFFLRDGVGVSKNLFLEYARLQGQLRIKCWNLMGQDKVIELIDKLIGSKVLVSREFQKRIEMMIEIILRNRRIPYGYNSYLNEVQKMRSFLSNRTKTKTLMESVKIKSVYQSASLIAQDISLKLRLHQISFRSILSQIVKDIPFRMPQGVEGIRLCCSGRLGGAEIARTECGKYGKTSCNVLNQKIDYASAEVSTRYGILGVKVWISYSKKKKGRAISETYEI